MGSGCGQPERADAADRVAGERQRLLGPEHARPAAERGLGLGIVEPGVAAGDEQERSRVDPHREGLGDPAGLDAERRGGGGDRRGAFGDLDQRQIGRVLGQPGADGLRLMPPAPSSAAAAKGTRGRRELFYPVPDRLPIERDAPGRIEKLSSSPDPPGCWRASQLQALRRRAMPNAPRSEARFWKALKSDMTLMLGLDGAREADTQPMTAQTEHDEGGPIWFFTARDNSLIRRRRSSVGRSRPSPTRATICSPASPASFASTPTARWWSGFGIRSSRPGSRARTIRSWPCSASIPKAPKSG